MVPEWKCRSSGKHWKAGSMRRSERNIYSWELYWNFGEITPSLQDVIICNFLALSQAYEKRRGLEIISPKASSKGLIRTCSTLWTWGATWKKRVLQMDLTALANAVERWKWIVFLTHSILFETTWMLKSLSGAFPFPLWWSSLESNFLWSLCPCGKLPICPGAGSGNSSALDAPAAWKIPGNLD